MKTFALPSVFGIASHHSRQVKAYLILYRYYIISKESTDEQFIGNPSNDMRSENYSFQVNPGARSVF
jgi:hypothetical protein